MQVGRKVGLIRRRGGEDPIRDQVGRAVDVGLASLESVVPVCFEGVARQPSPKREEERNVSTRRGLLPALPSRSLAAAMLSGVTIICCASAPETRFGAGLRQLTINPEGGGCIANP